LLKKCRSMPLFLTAMLMLVLGGALLLTLPRGTFSELENRMLTPLSDVRPLSDDFDEAFERWASDHFPGRDALISLDAALSVSMGEALQDGVLAGRGGCLLETPVTEVTRTALSAMDTLEEAAQTLGLPTYLALIPTSAEVLPDHLPALYEAGSQKTVLDALAAVAGSVIPVDSGLLLAGSAEKLYYRTDHHLTADGAWTVYAALCQAWGLQPQPASRTTVEGFRGSYYARIPDPRIAAEAFTVDIPEGLTLTVDGAERSFLSEAALDGRNKYAALIGETYAHACITGGAGEERLLVLSDSYANAIVPLLAQHFARVDVIDPRYYAGVLADTAQEVGSTRVLALFGLNTFSNNRGLALLTIGEE